MSKRKSEFVFTYAPINSGKRKFTLALKSSSSPNHPLTLLYLFFLTFTPFYFSCEFNYYNISFSSSSALTSVKTCRRRIPSLTCRRLQVNAFIHSSISKVRYNPLPLVSPMVPFKWRPKITSEKASSQKY